MTSAHPVYYTLEEYVAFEDSNPAKHEYLGGQIFAMAGGSAEHARLAAAVGAMIGAKLPAGCRMFGSDLRIRIDSADLTTYPDGVVICGNPILATGPDKYAYSNPRVVIEVLSPTTERYDRGDKLLYYQSLPSVQEVLLVSQNQPRVVVHRRSTLPSGAPTWVSIETGEHQWIELSSLEVRLDLDTLYRDKIE